MNEESKTKEELLGELNLLRGRVAELETLAAQLRAASNAALIRLSELREQFEKEQDLRRQAEFWLQAKEAELTAVFEHVPWPMIILDRQTLVRRANRAAGTFAGASPEEILGRRGGQALGCLNALLDPRGCGFGPVCLTCPVRLTVLRTFETWQPQIKVEAVLPFSVAGRREDLELLVAAIPMVVNGEAMVLVCVENETQRRRAERALRQAQEELELKVLQRTAELARANEELRREIADRKRIEAELRESEERYRLLVENVHEAILVLQDARIVFANEAALKHTGIPRKAFKLEPFDRWIHPEDRPMVVERYERRAREEDVPDEYDFRIIDGQNRVRWVTLRAVRITWTGRPATLNFIGDITRRKATEEALQAALQEKEVLLREIHHRVKNNMQVIASLFSLQANGADDKKVLAVLEEGRNRVTAMALIHEILYQSGTFGEVDFETYAVRLANILFQTYGAGQRGVTFSVTAQGVILNVDQAVPCGLVINELISNSLKHAFPSGGPGRISLTARPTEAGGLELTIGDDGVGLPEDLDWRDPGTLGLTLVVGLIEHQLGGKVQLDRRGGTTFIITLPPKPQSSNKSEDQSS